MEKQQFDVAVIGGGPGGYVAAIRAAQRGLKVALIEVTELGGTCLNRGCIPSKALIANATEFQKIKHAKAFGILTEGVSFDYSLMNQRKKEVVDKMRSGLEGLIASNQIKTFQGFGKFVSPYEIKILGKEEAVIDAKYTIIATGSEPKALSHIPFDGHLIHDSTTALEMTTLPKSIAIIGGGVIGCEFASLYSDLGLDVTIIEMLPSLIATEGKKMGETLLSFFKKRGIKTEFETEVVSFEKRNDGVRFHLKNGKEIAVDTAIVSIGRKLNTDKINLEKTGVIVEKNGAIPVKSTMQTNVSHIYAIGDVTAKWLLAHVASHQGIVAADHIAGFDCAMHYSAVPSVIFTRPEIGTVGMTLEKAIEQGFDATLGHFPFLALGKSQAILEKEGFTQIVVERKTGRLLGAQVVGYDASTLISQMTLAIQNELTLESLTDTIHAHPTLPEAWLESALLASGMPLHLPPIKKGAAK